MPIITVSDQTSSKESIGEPFGIEVPSSCTVRELIRFRVREEVAKHNAAGVGRFRGLVQLVNDSTSSAGANSPFQRLDWEQHADAAESLFKKNGFFVFVEARQLDDLDEVVELGADVELSFIRLIPLVGG